MVIGFSLRFGEVTEKGACSNANDHLSCRGYNFEIHFVKTWNQVKF